MTSAEHLNHTVTKKINMPVGVLPLQRGEVLPLNDEPLTENAAKSTRVSQEINKLYSDSIEPRALARMPVEQIVNLIRSYDEELSADSAYVRVAASRLDQVLELQLHNIPAEKKEAHKDHFYTQLARLLHTMPELLVYMKPEDRVRILQKYNPNVALWKRNELEHRYSWKFNSETRSEAFATFRESWEQIRKTIEYLESAFFPSISELLLEMQIDKLPGLSDKTATFKSQFTSIAIQTLLDIQTSMKYPESRELAKFAIQHMIRNVPIANALMEGPVVLQPNTTTKKVQFDIDNLTPAQKADLGITETKITQEIEAIKVIERSTEEYFVRPYLLLEMDTAPKTRIINEMFKLIETPEGLAKVNEVRENAKNDTEETPKTKLEEINEEVKTPPTGKVFIMQLLRQLKDVKADNLSEVLPLIVDKQYDLDPTHATAFYWVVRELLNTIIRCQELDQDEERMETERQQLVKRIEQLNLSDQVQLLQKLRNIKTENVMTELPIVLKESIPDFVATSSAYFLSTITELLEHLTTPNLSTEPQEQTVQLKTTRNAVKMGQRAQNIFRHLFTSTPEVKATETQIMAVVKPEDI